MVAGTRLAVGVTVMLALILALPVLAGGWAVITLDQLPGEVMAGKPLNIGFTVRQHGRTLMSGLNPTVTARLSGSSQTVTASVFAEGGSGHYVAVLTIPNAGLWEWSIQAFTMLEPMPPLTVVAGSGRTSVQPAAFVPTMPWLVVGVLGLSGCLAGIVLAFRRRLQPAFPLLAFGLALGIMGIISSNQPAPRAQALASPNLSPAELGKQLFIAKGCTTCHMQQDIHRSNDSFYVDVGPNLNSFASANPEYLKSWLKNPASVKPATQMPNLELSQAEIEALVAFLTAKK
ncbi:MAG TPA: cytochrome c [Anaerolineales bacterium]|jgi:cytochrome c551/c552